MQVESIEVRREIAQQLGSDFAGILNAILPSSPMEDLALLARMVKMARGHAEITGGLPSASHARMLAAMHRRE